MTSVNVVRHAQHIIRDAGVNPHAAPRSRHAWTLFRPDSNLPCQSSPFVLKSQGKKRQRAVQTRLNFTHGQHATSVVGRRQQAVACSAQIMAASAAVETPKVMQTPQEVSSVFQRLQNGSDIRGIAIAGSSIHGKQLGLSFVSL